MLLKDNMPTKGFLSIDRESDTMYFDGKHLSDVLKEFYEQDVEVTVRKLQYPIKDCFSCHCATCNKESEPCYSCVDFSNWITPQGYKDI